MFTANKLTASSSITAEHGSRCQPICTFASYAGISAATRRTHPILSAASESSIRRGLYRTRAPQKAGRILWPIAKTMVERNPTVRACRDAPQIPPFTSLQEARTDKAAATSSHTYARRTKKGKLGWTLVVGQTCRRLADHGKFMNDGAPQQIRSLEGLGLNARDESRDIVRTLDDIGQVEVLMPHTRAEPL